MSIARLLFYPTALILSVAVISTSLEATNCYQKYCAEQDLSGHVGRAAESIFEGLTLGLYSGGSDSVKEVNSLRKSAEGYYSQATVLGWLLFLLSLGFIIGGGFASGRFRIASISILDTIAVSIAFLLVGLIAPVINLVAYNDMPIRVNFKSCV